jgi:hypothetical protein
VGRSNSTSATASNPCDRRKRIRCRTPSTERSTSTACPCTTGRPARRCSGCPFDAAFPRRGHRRHQDRAPNTRMNAHRERIIAIELCDHVVILNRSHADRVLAAYRRHHNGPRPPGPPSATTGCGPAPLPRRTLTPADCDAPTSSAASSTSTDTRPDVLR